MNAGRKYRFDGFEVDAPNRTLLHDGQAIRVPGKAFDVLVALIENPGRLLSKDELVETVWASSFVEDGSVSRTVSTLRKALGDEGKEHHYIATVQGHGYRFIADVTNGSNGDGAAPTERASARDEVRHRPWALWTLAVIVIVVGAGLALSRLGLNFQSSGRSYSFDNARLTKITQTGNVFAPRISPDGQYLAYISATSKTPGLLVRHNASGSVLSLVPNAAGIWGLDIAPDNTFLYYIQKRSDAEKGDLYRIPLLGGVPFKVAELASGGLTISPDGSQVAFSRNDPETGKCSIIVVNNDGTNLRTLHSISYEDMYHALDWSPDGKSLAASIKRAEPDGSYKWSLAVINLSDGNELQFGNDPDMLVTGLEWLPDKSGLIASVTDRQTKQAQIYHVSYPDGLFSRITNDLDQYHGVSITADGRKVVTMHDQINRQIWVASEDGRATSLTSPGEHHIDSVAWIGDDDIAFSEDVNGTRNNYNIWRMRSDGSQLQQLTFSGEYNVELTASPDQRYIAFVSRRSGRDQLWRIGTDGSNLSQLTNVDHNVTLPMFSSDSKNIFFLGWVDAGLRLFKVPVDGGEPTQVLKDNIYNDWAVSPDGRRIAYLTFDPDSKRRKVVIAALDNAKPERMLDIISETCLGWSMDGRSLYFNSAADGATNLWRINLEGGKPEPVTEFNDQTIFRFAVSPRSGKISMVRESVTYDAVMLDADPQ